MRFDQIAILNPPIKITKGARAPFLDMAALPTHGRDVPIAGDRTFTSAGSRFQNGDTLIARITPCLENGKGAQIRHLPAGSAGFGSTEFIVARGRDERDSGFVYYLTRHEEFRAEAIKRMEGTSGRQRVAWQQIAAIEIPDVMPDDRREIASTLGALDDKIELNRNTAATLEEMARALFRSWFVDFDPVRAHNEGRAPAHMDEATAALFPDSFGEDGLPVGWMAGTLGQIARNSRAGVDPAKLDADVPYIGLEHIPRRSISIDDWGSAEDVGSTKSTMREGQFLFGKLRPYFHKVGLVPVDGICSTDILVVEAKAPSWSEFVLCVISSSELVGHVNAASTGTRMPRAKWQDLAGYDVVLPPEYIARAYSKMVAQMHGRILAMVHENRTLAALRDTLLPRLMSGELRVGAAREMIDEVA